MATTFDNQFNPKVSIVIPVYNGSNYLREAIDSALAQTYSNIEVIVVNDGSCDGGKTDAIATSYGKKIRYITKSNGGVASALNLGISLAKGEYISWLSHDDLYLPDKINQQVLLMTNMESNRVIIYSDFEALDVASGRLFIFAISHITPYDYLQDILSILFRSALHGCTLLLPRSCFEEAGFFDEQLKTTQDYTFWFKLIKQGYEFVHLPEVNIRARWHQDQNTHSMSGIHYMEVENLYIWACDQFLHKIITFPAGKIVGLIMLLRRRSLKISSDYMLDSIKQTSPKLYSTFRIRLLGAAAADKSHALFIMARTMFLGLTPKFVKTIVKSKISRLLPPVKVVTPKRVQE